MLSCLLVTLLYRRPSVSLAGPAAGRPLLSEVGEVLRRPGVALVFVCRFLFSLAQASILAYLTLYARETYAVSAVTAGRLLALAQVGGTLARLGGGWASDRFLGGRRRPGIVATAITAALA